LAVITAFPARRALLLTAATAYFSFTDRSWLRLGSLRRVGGLGSRAQSLIATPWVQIAMVLIVLAALAGMIVYAHCRPKSWLAKPAVGGLIATSVVLLLIASALRGPGVLAAALFGAALIVGGYLRFVGYILISPPIRSRREALLHAAMLHPMWTFV